MRSDPIIEEVHAIRQQLMREAGGKLSVAIERAHQVGMQFRAQHKTKVIAGAPRRPVGWVVDRTPEAAPASQRTKQARAKKPRT
ncbi:MAG: hypothetical protein ACOVO0_05830 [Burkholderiaceae bacterium]|jgi:hypothetical protein